MDSAWDTGKRRLGTAAFCLLLCLINPRPAHAYTVLTHEAIIDTVWETSLKPALLKRFPASTADELIEAHAYAYGGCIIQDMGYYPFGHHTFSDLTHYARSGDFVNALIRESANLDDYAFALGALEHYVADIEGHRLATNRAVAMLYPKLRRKYGDIITYWDDPSSHLRTEYGFDVVQVVAGRYASDNYRNFIGFEIAQDALQRATADTYSLELKDLLGNVTLALGTYRFAVRSIIPVMTKVAWSFKKDELRKEIPGLTRKKFLYNLSRSSFEKEWGHEYQKPGLGARIISFVLHLLPGGGPFGKLKIRTPTPEVEKLFMASVNTTVDRYKALLKELEAGRVRLPNENFDANEPVIAGKYEGADDAYEALLGKLDERKFAGVSVDLKQNILAYYKDLAATPAAKATDKQRSQRVKLAAQLDRLRAAVVANPVAAPAP